MKGQWYGSYIYSLHLFFFKKQITDQICKIQQEFSLKSPDVNPDSVFWFPYINPLLPHTRVLKIILLVPPSAPKIAICFSPKKWLGDLSHVASPAFKEKTGICSYRPSACLTWIRLSCINSKPTAVSGVSLALCRKRCKAWKVRWSQKGLENSKKYWDARGVAMLNLEYASIKN